MRRTRIGEDEDHAADADPAPKRARRSEDDVGKSQEEPDDWVHEAHSLLKRCQSHKKGFYFKEPVDPIALDILDYFEVITDPMDFSTVGKKITHGTYTDKEEFAADMRLVFSNAMTYNAEADEVWNAAKAMSTFFEDNWLKSLAILSGEMPDADDHADEGGGGGGGRNKGSSSKAVVSASKGGATKEVKGDMKVGQKYLKAVQEAGWKAGGLILLTELENNESSWPFMKPLPGIEGNPNIKKHMDIPTIRERLQSGQYIRGGRKDFLRDARTIFLNATATQSEDSQLYAMATKMSNLFELEWASLMLMLDRKDSLKTSAGAEDGGGGSSVAALKWEPYCEQVLGRLINHAQGPHLFQNFPPRPGSSKKLMQLYGDLVTEPMDLDTIKERLRSNTYNVPKDFNRDVWLVLNNAKLFYESDEMRSQKAKADVAEAILRDFEEDYANSLAKFSGEESASKTISVFASEPPLALPRKRQALARQDLPWKSACAEVVVAFKASVETVFRRERSEAEKASGLGAGDVGLEQALSALNKVGERVERGQHRHLADFVRDCRRCLSAARRDALVTSLSPGAGAAEPAAAGSSLKKELRDVLQSEVKARLEQVVSGMANTLRQASGQDQDELQSKFQDGDEPEEWFEEAKAVILSISRHPASWPFMSLPCPWTPQLWRYISKVSFPMDLSTVYTLLVHGHYSSLAQVAADVRLMLDNVKLAPDRCHDLQLLSDALRVAFLSNSSLTDPKELARSRQERRRQAKTLAAKDAAAIVAATAAEATYGNACPELREVENWKAVCSKLVRQLSGMPVAWVLQEVPPRLGASQGQSADSPGKHAVWSPKPIPGLAAISKRIQDGSILDPLQVLLEVRRALSQYMGPGISAAANAPDAARAGGEKPTLTKPGSAGNPDLQGTGTEGDAMDVDRGAGGDKQTGNDASVEREGGGLVGGGGAGAGLEEDGDGEDEMNEYIADDDETLRTIAKKFGITPEAINAYNRHTYKGITVNSKLYKGTVVRLPPRQPELLHALPPPPPANPDLSLRAQRQRAAERVLTEFEFLFKAAFFPEKKGVAAKALENAAEENGAPVLKYRKSQRFFHCKTPRKLVYVGRLLEKMMKNPIAAAVSERLEMEDARNVANPMDFATIRANIEMGLYATSDMCVSDIRLALSNAKSLYRDNSQAVQLARFHLNIMEEEFEKELLVGKFHDMAFGFGETRQEMPLSNPAFSQLAKDVVDRVMGLEEAEPFLKPVRPIEDGCADYSDVIREPVDLGTIRERLDQEGCGGYETLGDVTADVVLVFKNAMTYNIEKSQIHEDASESLKAFEADLAESLERVCTKGVEALQPADQQAGASKETRDDPDKADVQEDNRLRPQYIAPQVVAGVLQSKLEEWDRKPNWIDSFDHNLPLPSGWSVVHDQKTSKVYYWNKPANSTQWEQPKPPAVILPTPLEERAPVDPVKKAPPSVASAQLPHVGGSEPPTGALAQNGNHAAHNPVTVGAVPASAQPQGGRGDLPVKMEVDGAHVLGSSQAAGANSDQPTSADGMHIDESESRHANVETNAEHQRASSALSSIPQRKHLPSPYVGRYYCPIFCCWRPINTSEHAGAVRYYGK